MRSFDKISNTFIINNVAFVVDPNVENLFEREHDLLMNWMAPDMMQGPKFFDKILKKAGNQVRTQFYVLRNHLKPTDSFITNAGPINSDRIINSILPDNISQFNESSFKIKESLLTYSKERKCRFLGYWFPTNDFDIHIENLISYIFEVNTIRIIYIYCWPEELETIKKNFKKRIQKEKLNSFFKKIDRWISLR